MSFTAEELRSLKDHRDFVMVNAPADQKKFRRMLIKWAAISLSHLAVVAVAVVMLFQPGWSVLAGAVTGAIAGVNLYLGIRSLGVTLSATRVLVVVQTALEAAREFDEEYPNMEEEARKAELNAAFRQ